LLELANALDTLAVAAPPATAYFFKDKPFELKKFVPSKSVISRPEVSVISDPRVAVVPEIVYCKSVVVFFWM
jgi:hypothetical protein